MLGRTPEDAVEAFSTRLRQSLACILSPTAYLRAQGYKPGGGPYLLALAGQPGPLRLPGPLHVGLFIAHRYDVVESGDPQERWRVHSREYIYELTTAQGRTIASYHWHPDGQGEHAVPEPHVHLRAYTAPVNVSRVHWPTGRVALEAVIRCAIRDLQVPPRRADWATLLERHEQIFFAARSWG